MGLLQHYSSGGAALSRKVPLLRNIPPRAVGTILALALVNALVWAIVGVVLVGLEFARHEKIFSLTPGTAFQSLTGTAILAYTLGLRHALDADHISAIDLMTRRLVASNQRPVTVGTFFSLGHSTIVIITSIVVAATAATVSKKFGAFSQVGDIIGTSVSAAFLLLLGLANAYILVLLIKQMRKILKTDAAEEEGLVIEGGGCLFRVFKKMFKLVDRPWKMYPLGILFGLGFDTSSEIALLGISSIQGAEGTSIWLILILPILFTAGMCLLDTVDGALMMTLYTSTSLARDPIAILYYNIVLTCITVVVAIVIGTLQALGLALAVSDLQGPFWDGVQNANDHYDIVGGAVCGAFVVFGAASVVLYRPWRTWVDGQRVVLESADDGVKSLETCPSTEIAEAPSESSKKGAEHVVVEESAGPS